MMDVSASIPDLVATAVNDAKTFQDRIVQTQAVMGAGTGSAELIEDLREATVGLEAVAVDIFSVFEARMQHHFRRGPFSRKLKTLMLEAKKADLAERFHQYYLATNVLKHGTGASYRELRDNRSSPIYLRPVADSAGEDAPKPVGLVDVTEASYFDGLTATILEAYQFLENK